MTAQHSAHHSALCVEEAEETVNELRAALEKAGITRSVEVAQRIVAVLR